MQNWIPPLIDPLLRELSKDRLKREREEAARRRRTVAQQEAAEDAEHGKADDTAVSSSFTLTLIIQRLPVSSLFV